MVVALFALRALALVWVMGQHSPWGALEILRHPRIPFTLAMAAEGAMAVAFARSARAGGAAEPWRVLPFAVVGAALGAVLPLLFLRRNFGESGGIPIAASWMVAQALLALQAWRLVRRIRGMEGR